MTHPRKHGRTLTGRISCNQPNLQNIPIRTPEGARIKAAFLPGSWVWAEVRGHYDTRETPVSETL